MCELAVTEVAPDLSHRARGGIARQKNIQSPVVVEITERDSPGINSGQTGLDISEIPIAEVMPHLGEVNWEAARIHPGEACQEKVEPAIIIEVSQCDGAAGKPRQGGVEIAEQDAPSGFAAITKEGVEKTLPLPPTPQ